VLVIQFGNQKTNILNKIDIKILIYYYINNMSDSEYSDSGSDSEEENEFLVQKSIKPFKISKNIIDNIITDPTSDEEPDNDMDDIEDDLDPMEGGGENDIEIIDSDEDDELDVINKPATQIQLSTENYNEEDDDDEDEDINYLQKFNKDITNNYINEFHPECLQHNYDEISKLTLVLKNSDNIIVDPFHKTIPFLTKYEKARILGQRAKQIESGAKPFINIPENIIEGHIIAELELKEKKIPFIIKRPIPGGAFEYWKLADLEIII
jgi:DNA-directed RNA polymerase I, II, and III subunit RPABC2